MVEIRSVPAPSPVENPDISVTDADSPPPVSEYRAPQDLAGCRAPHCMCVHDADVDLEEGTSSLPSQSEFETVRQHIVCVIHGSGETALHQEVLQESHQDQVLTQSCHSEERAFGVRVDDVKSAPRPGLESSVSDADVEKGQVSNSIKQVDVAEEEGQGGCCRICQLAVDISPNTGDIFKLGCACKADLAVAHQRCAETWFMIKGNRTCEICGSTAQNVFANGDHHSAELWNEESRCLYAIPAERCWQSQPLLSKLLVCVVMVLFASWLCRVTLF